MSLSAPTRCTVVSLALLCAAACKPGIDVGTPRDYPCARDGGPAAACPEGSRCGLEGRCHVQGVASDYQCGSDDDCEAQWRCGLNGRCHPLDGGAYVCASDSDCDPGWRCACCGENRVCHPQSVGADYLCRTSADCEQGWHCGLEGRCHDPNVGAPYACGDDSQCEADWRCGVDGLCVDWRTEALRSDVYEGPLDEARLSPILGGAPELLACSAPGETAAQTFSFISDGGVTQVAWYSNGIGDAGTARAFATTVALDGGFASALASLGESTFFVDGAGLEQLDWDLGDGGVLRHLGGGEGTTRLWVASVDAGQLLMGLVGNGVWVRDLTSGVMSPTAPLRLLDGGAQQIFDLLAGTTFKGRPEDQLYLLAAGEEGLFVARCRDGGFIFADGGPAAPDEAWQPTEVPGLPNARCPVIADAGIGDRATHLDMFEWPNSATVGMASDAVMYVAYVWGLPFLGCGATPSLSVCPACPTGERLVDLVSGSSNNFVWCADADGGEVHSRGVYLNGGCSTTSSYAPERLVRLGRAGPNHAAHGDGSGNMVSVSESYVFTDHLVERGLWLNDVSLGLFKVGGRRWIRTASSFAFEEPGVGFVASSLDVALSPISVIRGAPEWVFGKDGGVFDLTSGTPRTAATFDVTLGAAGDAVFASSPDGGQMLIAAFDDKLVAGPLTDPPSSLEIRIAPQAFRPILSLTAVTPSAGVDGGAAPWAEGYALTGSGLYRFVAETQLRWKSAELLAPLGGVTLWSDGHAGRLGYGDGTVMSLPTRVVLSGALVDAGTVEQYAQLCGQTFALATSGLYRLQPAADAGLAVWAVEPLPTLGDRTFVGARLDVDGQQLLISTPHGGVVRLTPPLSCH
jgi:hypothetical protein